MTNSRSGARSTSNCSAGVAGRSACSQSRSRSSGRVPARMPAGTVTATYPAATSVLIRRTWATLTPCGSGTTRNVIKITAATPARLVATMTAVTTSRPARHIERPGCSLSSGRTSPTHHPRKSRARPMARTLSGPIFARIYGRRVTPSVTDRAWAAELDAGDPIAEFRDRFLFGEGGPVYLDGNSLGRLPLATAERIAQVVRQEWGTGLIRSWDHWVSYPAQVGDLLGEHLLGAAAGHRHRR